MNHMTNPTKSLLKNLTKKAKETASEGKERFAKWAEAEKLRKYKENVERKDQLGNDILSVKKQIAKTEEKLVHLQESSIGYVTVAINGMDIDVSVQTILAQYEETFAKLNKRKEKMAKEFLIVEEKINNDKESAEKLNEMEKLKEIRYRSIKTGKKEVSFTELLPLMTQLPHHLNDGDKLTLEESFGSLELAYKNDTLEYCYNGMIVYVKLNLFQVIEHVAIIDWRHDDEIFLADGNAENIALLNWKTRSSSLDYQEEFFEMTRALKYVFLHHFETTHVV